MCGVLLRCCPSGKSNFFSQRGNGSWLRKSFSSPECRNLDNAVSWWSGRNQDVSLRDQYLNLFELLRRIWSGQRRMRKLRERGDLSGEETEWVVWILISDSTRFCTVSLLPGDTSTCTVWNGAQRDAMSPPRLSSLRTASVLAML